ncbi:2-oxo-4-hydroxy-4-carboxy-5-ureidoimidazoline decarboxylase [Rummeliibacillus suwonensis]|uniref:2-oxo-4-hydroxy-4-carboxy-5-ureidoimidazoline decarboxylase n=1 Tax=Rummeliibacillus suwonensis TaxID=1306154 RepID=UPI0028A1ABD2|nr:2-oxo-4-hydroxy-4-carboxy-5-ureidoimidazoline decarboxylase [Rummeliibacillus suwonensis]
MNHLLVKINHSTADAFIEFFQDIFESSTWIPQQAVGSKPFNHINDIFKTMHQVLEDAPTEKKLELIRAHPELGKKIRMSLTSTLEQQKAGLNMLTEDEYNQFLTCNRIYKEKFHFPFIIAVADYTKSEILQMMQSRLTNSYEEEFQIALKEINRIAELRFAQLIEKMKSIEITE